jgi:hypothetical protein
MSRQGFKLMGVAAAAALSGVIATKAEAVTYGFDQLTTNTNTTVASQLFVDVLAGAAGQVVFTFTNLVGVASSISEIYFDDGTLLGIASIDPSGPGVDFSQGATPPKLPGGNTATPPFVTTQGFLASSDNPQVANGINTSSEWLAITFNLIGGQTFANTIAALASGDLRIGLHVTGLAGSSDSFINDPSPVPIPPALLLFGGALAGLGVIAKRRRNTQPKVSLA